jgi:hypothetical protein
MMGQDSQTRAKFKKGMRVTSKPLRMGCQHQAPKLLNESVTNIQQQGEMTSLQNRESEAKEEPKKAANSAGDPERYNYLPLLCHMCAVNLLKYWILSRRSYDWN